MAGQGIPPREMFTADLARNRPMLVAELPVPLRGLEVPNDFVLPSKRLTTGLADLRWTLALARVMGDLPTGDDDRHASTATVRVTKNAVPFNFVFSRRTLIRSGHCRPSTTE
jgi:hypothetical protein